jgi:hypothetical protein
MQRKNVFPAFVDEFSLTAEHFDISQVASIEFRSYGPPHRFLRAETPPNKE